MVQMMNTGSNLGASAGGSQRINFLITAANMTGPAVMGAMANMQGLSAISMRMGNQLGSTLTLVEGAMAAIGAAGAIAIGVSTLEAAKYENGMKQVQAIAGATNQEMAALGEQAKGLSMQYGMSFDDINNGLMTLGRAGFKNTATQTQVLEEGLKLAKLEGMELGQTIEDLISTTNLLHPELDMNSPQYIDALEELNSQMVAVSQAAPITVHDIIQSLKYSGGIASAEDIDQADLLGTIGYFGSKGVKGDIAGTALRAFLTRPASQTAQVTDSLGAIGLKPSDLWEENGNKAKSIATQIGLINDKMDQTGLSQMQRIELWQKLVGPKQANQMMKLDREGMQKYIDKAREGVDLDDKMATIMDSVQQKWNKFVQSFRTLLINVGDIFLKIVGPVLDTVTGIVGFMATNPFITWTIAIGAATAVFLGGIVVLKWFGAALIAGIGAIREYTASISTQSFSLNNLGIALGFVADEEATLVAKGQAMYAESMAKAKSLQYQKIATGELVVEDGKLISAEDSKTVATKANTLETNTNTSATNTNIASLKTKTAVIEEQIAAISALNKIMAENTIASGAPGASVGKNNKTTPIGYSRYNLPKDGVYLDTATMQSTQKKYADAYKNKMDSLVAGSQFGATRGDFRSSEKAGQQALKNINQATENGVKTGVKNSEKYIAQSFEKATAMGVSGSLLSGVGLPGGEIGSSKKIPNYKGAGVGPYSVLDNVLIPGGRRGISTLPKTTKMPSFNEGAMTPIGPHTGKGPSFWNKNFLANSFLKNNSTLQKGLASSSQGIAGLSTVLMGLISPIGIAIMGIVALIAVFTIWYMSWKAKLDGAKESLKKNQDRYENSSKSVDEHSQLLQDEQKKADASNASIKNHTAEINKNKLAMQAAAAGIARATREIQEAESDNMWGSWGLAKGFKHAFGMDSQEINDVSEGLMYNERAWGWQTDKNIASKWGQDATLNNPMSSYANDYISKIMGTRQYQNLISLTNANYKYLSSLYDVETEIMQTSNVTKEQARNTNQFKTEMEKISKVTGMTSEQIKMALDQIEMNQKLSYADDAMSAQANMYSYQTDLYRPENYDYFNKSGGGSAVSEALKNADTLGEQILVMMAWKYAQEEYHEVWWQVQWNNFMLTLIAIYSLFAWTGSLLIAILSSLQNLQILINNLMASIPGSKLKKQDYINTNAYENVLKGPQGIYKEVGAPYLWSNEKYKGLSADGIFKGLLGVGKPAYKGAQRTKVGKDETNGSGTDSIIGNGSESDSKTTKIQVDFLTCRKQIIPKIQQMSLFGNGPLLDLHKHTIAIDNINVTSRDDADSIGTAVDNRLIQTANDLYPVTVSKRSTPSSKNSSNKIKET